MAAESINGLQNCRSFCAGCSDTDGDANAVKNVGIDAGKRFSAVMIGYGHCSSIL